MISSVNLITREKYIVPAVLDDRIMIEQFLLKNQGRKTGSSGRKNRADTKLDILFLSRLLIITLNHFGQMSCGLSGAH